MGKENCVLHPPEGLQAIHGFYYKKNQIILMYSTSYRDDSWINIYKDNHVNNSDIVRWCQDHGINYEFLNRKNARIFERFVQHKESDIM